jgi:L-seryl-tRNA(Ser) seleniumtransferase
MSNPNAHAPAERLRELPAISKLMECADGKKLASEFSTPLTLMVLRDIIQAARGALLAGTRDSAPTSSETLIEARAELTRLTSPQGRRAINATGIILHTGLGRAPLSESAIAAIQEMRHYSVLEVRLSDGERSQREERVSRLLRELTGAGASTVVNNNAAATLLVLKTFAEGREVLISRGQLIEIGGSFRMPEIMEQSGCILREVGTTNRSYASDYAKALTSNTGAIIRVHPSNYRIHGFTAEPSLAELIEIGGRAGVPVIDDLGSGELQPVTPYGLCGEGLVRESITAGADAVCFSGDKLISGPQAGIICGKPEHIRRMRAHPFFRMFRIDKLCLAALEATLVDLIQGTGSVPVTPVYQMLARRHEDLRADALRLSEALRASGVPNVTVQDDEAYCGGGASPDRALQDVSVAIRTAPRPAGEVTRLLRQGIPSVFCRIQADQIVLNMRTLRTDDTELLRERLLAVLSNS